MARRSLTVKDVKRAINKDTTEGRPTQVSGELASPRVSGGSSTSRRGMS